MHEVEKFQFIIIDRPVERVARVTLNRPEKRNALSNLLRTELFTALELLDCDPQVGAIILCGNGKAFSAGYDLQLNAAEHRPFHTAGGLGGWPRHVAEGCMRMWDMATPMLAQVHGYCLAGGSELAAACDLVYVADDAQIGYPVVRSISPPDNQLFPWIVGMRRAMELMLTGEAMNGVEAVACGFANRAFPVEELPDRVVEIAEKVARVPFEIQQINKRAVHRQMEIMGIRAGIRAGTELQQLATLTRPAQEHLAEISEGLTNALTNRDAAFGDYRTKKDKQ